MVNRAGLGRWVGGALGGFLPTGLFGRFFALLILYLYAGQTISKKHQLSFFVEEVKVTSHPFPGQPSAVGIKLARMRSIQTPSHTSCTSRPLLWPGLPACTGSSILHQDLGPHPSFHPSDCKRIAHGLPPGCPPEYLSIPSDAHSIPSGHCPCLASRPGTGCSSFKNPFLLYSYQLM